MMGKVLQASNHRFDAVGRSYKPVITGSMLGKVSQASDHRFDAGEGLTSQ